MIVGGVAAGIAGVLIGIPVLRLRGDYLAIVTLAFGEIIRNVINCLYISAWTASASAYALFNAIHELAADGKLHGQRPRGRHGRGQRSPRSPWALCWCCSRCSWC